MSQDANAFVFDVKVLEGYEEKLFPKFRLVEVKDFMGETVYNIGFDLEYDEFGRIAPYATLTVNFGEFIGAKNCAYIDTNNCPYADQILTTGIAKKTGLTKRSGFCEYPLWVFDEEFLKTVGGSEYETYSKKYDEYMASVHNLDEE